MKNLFTSIIFLLFVNQGFAQNKMSPEMLWKLARMNPIGISADEKLVYYRVTKHEVLESKKSSVFYALNIADGNVSVVEKAIIKDKNISPDGKFLLSSSDVKIKKVNGQDYYPELKNSNAYIYDNLHHRHWDSWEDGKYGHLFISSANTASDDSNNPLTDIMEGEPFDCPQKPFGGDEDYIWSPDSKNIIYVSKKKFGTAYATSTNTDLYQYNLETKKTINLTEGMLGYDTHPEFGTDGTLAWLSMKNDGYEADKNDIIILRNTKKINLTEHWDGSVESYKWDKSAQKIYFTAAINGTKQLFELSISEKEKSKIKQLTNGDFDVNSIIGQAGNSLLVLRNDFNHASEIYAVGIGSGNMKQLSHVNDEIYNNISLCKSERRMVKTTDNKEMLTWVVYPPDFDPNKKYPTLLYCQGGPQSPLTQFYSYRWNLQLMASQGYIVVAPNRRGMYGYGVKWNEDISKDWGGQCMNDYLSAIDDISKEKYIDKNRIACIGASFGGYSAFYLAGKHEGRFKSFIAHCGIFNLHSMYGTTEEIFFTDWDMGGAYWEKDNKVAQKTYKDFNPINFVDKWDTPILIFHGGKDYRVPYSQGMEAFQAAQLRGIKSRFIYMPDENHWVQQPQTALLWHREFFRWLSETLN
jgi:dipeptidyl aminopeptidase/acylaminoacyl peptidase